MEGYSSNSMILVENNDDLLHLTERDQEYLEIVDGSFEGSFIHYIESEELYMSTIWKRRLGLEYLSPEEACSMMFKIIHPDDQNKHMKAILESYHCKASKARLEFRVKTFDASYIWVSGLIKIDYNEAGKPIKRYGINIDITEKKKQEEVLRENEQLYKALFKNIEDAFQLVEPIYDEKGSLADLRYLKVNDQFENHSGLNANDVIGKTVREVLLSVEPSWLAICEKVLKTEKSTHFDNYNHATNRWYDVFCFPCFQGNLGIIFRDITRKRLAEQELLQAKEELARRVENQYYKLFNSIDEGFCMVDMVFDPSDKPVDYRIIETNTEFDEYCGFSGLKGKLISEITSEVDAFWVDIFGKVALTGEPIRYESYVKLYDSWLSIYAFKMNHESKGNVAVLFKDISSDVMERLELENSLHIQDQMFSNVSHELRTPLNVLLGAIQLMESQDSGRNQKSLNLLRAMKQNCFRLIRLVNNIIDVSKIDSNNMNVNFRTCNMVSLVEDITVSIAAYAEMKGIELLFDTNEEELMMSTDSDFIERIILNLLSNSLKYTDENGQILVTMQVKEKSVMISIKDTGEGIPEDKLAIIFQRYGQASKQFYRRAEGTGIGLHLTKKLIDILGGTISVNSKLGEGTEFIIELPIRHMEEHKTDAMIQKSLAERISIEFSDIYKN